MEIIDECGFAKIFSTNLLTGDPINFKFTAMLSATLVLSILEVYM
jgi:hypothetical protein